MKKIPACLLLIGAVSLVSAEAYAYIQPTTPTQPTIPTRSIYDVSLLAGTNKTVIEWLISYAAFFVGSFVGMGLLGSLLFWVFKKIMSVNQAAITAIAVMLILVFWNLPPDMLVRLILYIPACVVFGRIWMGSKPAGKTTSSATSIVCSACNQPNNPLLKQCWKCGSPLGGTSSSSGGESASAAPISENKVPSLSSPEVAGSVLKDVAKSLSKEDRNRLDQVEHIFKTYLSFRIADSLDSEKSIWKKVAVSHFQKIGMNPHPAAFEALVDSALKDCGPVQKSDYPERIKQMTRSIFFLQSTLVDMDRSMGGRSLSKHAIDFSSLSCNVGRVISFAMEECLKKKEFQQLLEKAIPVQ